MKDVSTLRTVVARGAMAGVAIAAGTGGVIALEQAPAIEQAGVYGGEMDATAPGASAVDDVESTGMVAKIRGRESYWDEVARERFMELAEKDALDGLSEAETAEMEVLQRVREMECAPRSFEDLIAISRFARWFGKRSML